MQKINKKIFVVNELEKKLKADRGAGKSIVQCHGCFDIVHPGHIRYLQFAKKHGDILVVTISSDNSVFKGVGRPYINEKLRAENLAVLEFVDYVAIDDNEWAGPVLDKLKPDIYVKGKEYETNQDPRFSKERALVESYGGSVIFGSGDVVYSSTKIINTFSQKFDLEHQKISYFCERNQLTYDRLIKVIRNFSDFRILVVGDLISDLYISCEDMGLASESPMLSVRPVREERYVGGAGLIALQLAQLGAKVIFLTAVNKDSPDVCMAVDILEAGGVEVEVLHCCRREIYLKKRYVAQNQKLLKVDYGSPMPLTPAESQEFIYKLNDLTEGVEAVVGTDFGYGLFSQCLLSELSTIGDKKKLYFDVSSRASSNLRKVKNTRCVMPTETEIRAAYGDFESGLSNLAARYFNETDGEQIAITLGEKGVVYFENNEQDHPLRTEYLPSLASMVIDTVGAGDAFLSGFVLADLVNENAFSMGFYFGSCLSAMHLSKMANSPESLIQLEEFLKNRSELVLNSCAE
ncbi:PfkB family carbohydrate kinase [Aliikangiella sp. G2MR2-5]|uniref:PfkB family carbohydrate kinase n=1 Tax=Aliikangiella sp. G2MR2-5 TaxID=2788943 RepID=UPI0018A8E79D|nr:PfkB family carbohydrate kinase [Aliikangiella sp. G2MR2-5]